MFGEFLSIIVRSIKLDKTLYKDNKNFGEAAIYFAGINNDIRWYCRSCCSKYYNKTPIAMSGLTCNSYLVCLVNIYIYVIGVKIVS